jgi:hypothetical protein
LIGYNSTDINILLRRDEEKYFGNWPCCQFADICCKPKGSHNEN